MVVGLIFLAIKKTKVHSCLYSYVPFALLLIMNAMLIFMFKNRSVHGVANNASRKRQSSMTRTVIFVTLLFILMTGPGAVVGSMFAEIMSQSYGHLVLVLVDCIAFSYHAYGLILLYKTNIKFANQLRAIANFAEKEPKTRAPKPMHKAYEIKARKRP